jgi:hypothetical protein
MNTRTGHLSSIGIRREDDNYDRIHRALYHIASSTRNHLFLAYFFYQAWLSTRPIKARLFSRLYSLWVSKYRHGV